MTEAQVDVVGRRTDSIPEIVLTGGSCAGKTTALALLSRSLSDQGFHVLTVPETVTLMVGTGVRDLGEMARHGIEGICKFEREVYAIQRAFRNSYQGLARLFNGEPAVILYDRGELDNLAYHDHECIGRYAAEDGLSLGQIRDSYTAVMHLVSAAEGAESAYFQSGNPARWDNVDEARFYDRRLLEVWAGHPQRVVIDNSTNFVGKMERLQTAIISVLRAHAQSCDPAVEAMDVA